MTKRPTPPQACGQLATDNGPCVTTATHKRCSACKCWLKHKHFGRQAKRLLGVRDICKLCRKAIARRDREKARAYTLQKKYGLSMEDYASLLFGQNGKCDICGVPASDVNSIHFAVDHNHVTGAVRGLLCSNCNTGMGLLGDNTSRLLKAVEYLRKHE